MQPDLLQLIAGRRGHFRMESGYHSEQWFELGRLFAEPERVQPFATQLARKLAMHCVEAVCGPVDGGALLAEMIGRELGVESFATERFEPVQRIGEMFPVNYRLPPTSRAAIRGKAVAIVDDAISAGSAVRGTYTDLLDCDARPVALGALIVFGEKASRFAAENVLPLEYVTCIDFKIWSPEECPLCQRGVPLETTSDST